MCVYLREKSRCLFCSSPQILISSKQYFSFMDMQLYVPAWYKMRKASSTAALNSIWTLMLSATTKHKVLFQDSYWNYLNKSVVLWFWAVDTSFSQFFLHLCLEVCIQHSFVSVSCNQLYDQVGLFFHTLSKYVPCSYQSVSALMGQITFTLHKAITQLKLLWLMCIGFGSASSLPCFVSYRVLE